MALIGYCFICGDFYVGNLTYCRRCNKNENLCGKCSTKRFNKDKICKGCQRNDIISGLLNGEDKV